MKGNSVEEKERERCEKIATAMIVGELIKIAEKPYRTIEDREKVTDLESKFYWLVCG